MTVELPLLPYPADALEPFMSARTLTIHHGAHHAGYVDKLNTLIAGTGFEQMGLAEIIETTAGNESRSNIFNNAAQTWNHTFFWHSMTPGGGGEPAGPLAKAIAKAFGSFGKFRTQFVDASVAQFGSGWAWLVVDNCHLKITTTANAALPLIKGQHALLTCDLWEHAYYLDYQSRRKAFVETFLDRLVNWDFAARNLDKVDFGEAA